MYPATGGCLSWEWADQKKLAGSGLLYPAPDDGITAAHTGPTLPPGVNALPRPLRFLDSVRSRACGSRDEQMVGPGVEGFPKPSALGNAINFMETAMARSLDELVAERKAQRQRTREREQAKAKASRIIDLVLRDLGVPGIRRREGMLRGWR